MDAMLLLLALACSPPPYGETAVDTGETATDSGGTSNDTALSIKVTWPPEEASVVACTMVVVEVRNFDLVRYGVGRDDTAGEGHYHVYYSTTFEACDAPYCLVDLTGLPEDGYVLTARLAENNHDPILDENGDYIEDSVAINLSPGTCEASLAGLP